MIGERLARTYPASNLGWSVKVEPLLVGINGDLTPLYYRLILTATGFVLLVVCANVANLQFVRGLSRRPEIAVRTALGAGRGRLLRHLLTENLVLGGLGAAGGLVLAAICMHLCVITMPKNIERYISGVEQHLAQRPRSCLLSLPGNRCGPDFRAYAGAEIVACRPGRPAQGQGRAPPALPVRRTACEISSRYRR